MKPGEKFYFLINMKTKYLCFVLFFRLVGFFLVMGSGVIVSSYEPV